MGTVDGRKSTRTLGKGVEIPVLGLGLYKAPPGGRSRQAVAWALAAGYRHIDTASLYGNEADVRVAIEQSGLPRDQVFIATKVWKDDMGYDRTLRACERSLEELGTDHIDLYLVHWPVPGSRDDTWRALQTLAGDDRARAIGVCNYTVRHLEQLLSWADVPPAVDRVELSPFLQQRDLCDYCARHGIRIEAYSPLTRKRRLKDEPLRAVAARSGLSVAQVLLRWATQRGLVALVKSLKREHMEEDIAALDVELAAADMDALDALDEGFRVAWDPTDVE
ncbi:MAG: aldo/keto reductase [Actinobacteria bacterium]|nr:aldo/keto reductase [Actinomycetota bacterium]